MPANLPTPSKYTTYNGFFYLAAGNMLIAWPAVTQTFFMDQPFVGHEQGLVRALGLTVVVIGWLYVFGGRSGERQFVVATVIERVVFVPAVFVPLAIGGVFPHLMVAFAILDVALGIGAWVLLSRTRFS